MFINHHQEILHHRYEAIATLSIDRFEDTLCEMLVWYSSTKQGQMRDITPHLAWVEYYLRVWYARTGDVEFQQKLQMLQHLQGNFSQMNSV